MKNRAYIDGQNLYMGLIGWKINHYKLRKYLYDKYMVEEAYYFLGYVDENLQDVYTHLQKAGFILMFKEHNSKLKGKKKGNVDTDIVFSIMQSLVDEIKNFNKVVLISGDGDYKKMVDYLIKKNKFEKILFPNKQFASSLYKELGSEFFDYLDNVKEKIQK